MTLDKNIQKRSIVALFFAVVLLFSNISFVPAVKADFLSCALDGKNILKECINEDNGDVTDFTEFDGGLTQPGAEGYDPSLTQADSARSFILNVTNFVLGFLGLIAVLIIIYGGFLYLTAAGKEEQATKGKNSLTYAIIGIVIILGSYAIVNTILLSASPEGENALNGAAPQGAGGTQSDQQAARQAMFNFAVSEVKTVARDFATAYVSYTEINKDIIELNNVPAVTTSSQLSSLISSKKRIIKNIQQKAGTCSQVSQVVDKVEIVLDKYSQLSQASLASAAGDETEWYAFWDDGADEFQSELEEETGEGGLGGANDQDFARAITDAHDRIEDLKVRIEKNVNLQTLGIEPVFTDLLNKLKSYASSSSELAQAPTNNDILEVLSLMADLQEAVKNIQFVYTVISTDVSEGNAPLIVQFDGLKSLDPNNVTLTDYTWDFGDNGQGCGGFTETAGPSVIHCFSSPGTYVVKLMVKGSEGVADGVATTRVTVHPPANKIVMKAEVNNEEIQLRNYDKETGHLLLDKDVLKITPSEATSGITFDASETDKNKVQSVKWDFGDNSEAIVGTTELSQEKVYENPGTYRMVMEITDNLGNKDRKIVNVVVGDPIARLTVTPGNRLFVNQEVNLDAGMSTSDGGQIKGYKWNVGNAEGFNPETGLNSEILKGVYTDPGYKEVELEVTDSLDNKDTTKINFVIESKAPVAEFKYAVPDSTQPAVVELNGSLSYDPDGDEDLQYKWEIDGQENGSKFSFIDSATSKSESAKVKFKEAGTYSVALTVIDPKGMGNAPQESEITEKQITIGSILDIAWGEKDKSSAMLKVDGETGRSKAPISLTLISDNAVSYEVRWGDGEVESGEIKKSIKLSHSYTESGTYVVESSVFNNEDDENTISRKIFISSADTPVAVASILVNGNKIFDTTKAVQISRTDTVTFDGSESLNTDGTGRRLKYSWDFGNGQKSTQEKSNQQYKEIGEYTTTLKVSSSTDSKKVSAQDTIEIVVIGEPPILRSITAVPTSSDLTAPVTVQVQAVGAEDPDGHISKYKWWYYDPKNDTDQFGVQITTAPTATLTIGTRGLEGEEKTYKFAVEITDDENNKTNSRDLLSDERTATLTVTNGPNKAPVASFTVDKTSIMVGDPINFSSSSVDTDGQIVGYIWDFEGDGFANNEETAQSNISYVFKEASADGIKVKLKVRDNNESESVSDPITIFIDAIAEDPKAAFVAEQKDSSKGIKFTDNTDIDTEYGVTLENIVWDFDITNDSNGDGIKDNDIDSVEKNPTFTYKDYGMYRAKLSVEDSEGGKSSIVNFVNVKAPTAEVKGPSLEARLLTNPAPNLADGKVHIKGDSGRVALEYSTSIGEISKYSIDKNIYFDSDGNGKKDDDEDYKSDKPGKWTTEFKKDWGQIRVRLSVYDADGSVDTVDKDITFDSVGEKEGNGTDGIKGKNSLSANLLGVNSTAGLAFLVSLVGFAILRLYRKRRLKNKQNE